MNLEEIKNVDVFISYHGGNIEGGASSYKKAQELKFYFENHAGKKLKCFLCKEEKSDDFYDSIKEALISAKHFILVACDKTMLSQWVAEEVKQFDGLKKLGKKPNSVMNAYIFGSMTVDDLMNFNPVFSTKDIGIGEGGFEALYKMILEKCENQEKDFFFNYGDSVVDNISYIRPLARRFDRKLSKYLEYETVSENIRHKVKDDIIAFEGYGVEKVLEKEAHLLDDFIIVRLHHPMSVAEYLMSKEYASTVKMLLVDYETKTAALIIDGKVISIPDMNELALVFKNETLKINVVESSEKNLLEIECSGAKIEMPGSTYSEFGEIPCYVRKISESSWNEISTDVYNTNFCLYVLNILYNNLIPKGTIESDEIYDEIDFCLMELDDAYNEAETEKRLISQKEKSLLQNETLLWDYYRSIKSGVRFGEEETKRLFSSKYADLAYKLKEYYSKHSVNILNEFLDKIIDYAETEKKDGFYSRYEYLIKMVSEIYLHNIFILDYTFMTDNNIYGVLKELFANEYIKTTKNKLLALICSYKKEMYFCGNYEALELDALNANEVILDEFEKAISIMTESVQDIESNEYKSELLLLYRERCVIFEHCGDASLKADERRDFYVKWKNDCELALDIAKHFDYDKELVGCVYLNLASSINRLSSGQSGRIEKLGECLKNLDIALELFKTNSADRYIAYSYMHKSDCYEAMLAEMIRENGGFDFEKMADVVRDIRRNSTQAANLFKNTSDDIAKSWATRLFVKGKILSNKSALAENMRSGLKGLRDALRYCKSSNYVNGMAACVRDFTFYSALADEYNLTTDIAEEMSKTFFEEMTVFASIIKLLKLDIDDITEVQHEIEKIVLKLID